MLRFLVACFEIVLFRKNPADLPGAAEWAVTAMLLYSGMGLVISLVNFAPRGAVLQVAADVILLLVFVYVMLRIRSMSNRLPQTVSALGGTGFLFSLFALPIMISIHAIGAGDTEARTIPGLMLVVLILWNIAVLGHIFRYALDVRPGVGVALALVYVITSMVVASAVSAPIA